MQHLRHCMQVCISLSDLQGSDSLMNKTPSALCIAFTHLGGIFDLHGSVVYIQVGKITQFGGLTIIIYIVRVQPPPGEFMPMNKKRCMLLPCPCMLSTGLSDWSCRFIGIYIRDQK